MSEWASQGSSFLSAPATRGDKVAAVSGEVRFDDVKAEWKELWHCRVDDKVSAENMASRDFSLLFVERGTVIAATRDFKPLNLKEILRAHDFVNVDRLVGPHPAVGGYVKFAKTVLNRQARARSVVDPVPVSGRCEEFAAKEGRQRLAAQIVKE